MGTGGKRRGRNTAGQVKRDTGAAKTAPDRASQTSNVKNDPVKTVPAGAEGSKPDVPGAPADDKAGKGRYGRRRRRNKPSDDHKKPAKPSNKRSGFWKKKKQKDNTGKKEGGPKKDDAPKKDNGPE